MAAGGICVLGLLAYAIRLDASAKALIDSASKIRTTADAKQEVAIWRNRSDCSFWENATTSAGDQSYDIHVENGLISRLGVTRPAMVGVTVALRNGELRYVTLVMFSGKSPSSTAGVWIQEWFGLGTAGNFRIDRKDRPRKATIEFSSLIPESDRKRAFGLNANCFVRFGGCKSAEDILPGVWQWQDHDLAKGS
jgi:hypothetical protein